ncbi:hypothetical protein HPB48_006928 [Haemaphysalis longicornis]|uniref:C2H2-type domain-containing protein n=1 Tax=Haemaphysalis longicornis TaxID=44386 RepID=A0A9J6FPN3_HAELO|nr:hypothetical protein HPB48_006928 [Haemaphysalis longicornis]
MCNSLNNTEDVEELDAAVVEDQDEDKEESLTCNVCERSVTSGRLLSQHQQRKGHFGCPVCDALFPCFFALEHHRDSLEHWSDDEEYEALHRSGYVGYDACIIILLS